MPARPHRKTVARAPWPAVAALGWVCQIGQILLLREFLMVFHGNELSIGIVLAAWMVWVGVGSQVAARVVPAVARPQRWLYGSTLLITILFPLTILATRLARGGFDVVPGAFLSITDMMVASFLIMAPVCLLLGGQFVILARLWREHEERTDTHTAGKAYMVEALGNIVGGLLFTFLLVHLLEPMQGAALLAVVLLGAVWAITQRGWRRGWPLWIGLIAVAALSPWLGRIDGWGYQQQWRHIAPEHTLVESRLSRYGRIAVAQREDQFSFFQSGHLMFSAAGPEADVESREELEAATLAHFALSQHPDPRAVLLIGGGMRGTLRELARHPVDRIDYVELDRVLVDLAREFVGPATLAALENPVVHLRHMDGRLFVKTREAQYDVVVVDVPDPSTAVLNRFYTQEFFQEAARSLRPGGVLVFSVMSTADLRGSAVANRNATLQHTLSSVFAEVLPVGDRTLYFVASDQPGQILTDPFALRARFMERGIQDTPFSPGQFQLLLEEGPLRRVNWILRHHGRHAQAHLEPPDTGPMFPPSVDDQIAVATDWPPVHERTFINTDFRPVGYFYTLAFWNVLTRTDLSAAFHWLGRMQPWWVWPPVGLAFGIALLLRLLAGKRSWGRRYGVQAAVFTTGLSTMALQIAILFAFQSVYGFVYAMIGLIVALFMAGLLCGAWSAQRWIKRKDNRRLLAAVQAGIALFAVAIVFALPGFAAWPSAVAIFTGFALTTFVAGLLNGVDFPLTVACHCAVTGRADTSTGVVYGGELLGACLGAVLASAVIAPVLGITACCWLAAIANATACGILLITR